MQNIPKTFPFCRGSPLRQWLNFLCNMFCASCFWIYICYFVTPWCDYYLFFCWAQKSQYFAKIEVPEAQELGMCRFFWDLAVGHGPGAWEGPLTPKIEVSDPENRKYTSNRIMGLVRDAPWSSASRWGMSLMIYRCWSMDSKNPVWPPRGRGRALRLWSGG